MQLNSLDYKIQNIKEIANSRKEDSDLQDSYYEIQDIKKDANLCKGYLDLQKLYKNIEVYDKVRETEDRATQITRDRLKRRGVRTAMKKIYESAESRLKRNDNNVINDFDKYVNEAFAISNKFGYDKNRINRNFKEVYQRALDKIYGLANSVSESHRSDFFRYKQLACYLAQRLKLNDREISKRFDEIKNKTLKN